VVYLQRSVLGRYNRGVLDFMRALITSGARVIRSPACGCSCSTEAIVLKPRSPADASSLLLDASETGKAFGWRVEVPLAEGVPRTIDYYRECRVSEPDTHLHQAE
jgi:nucleoside-diphosphate-sugar epimerase